MILGRLVGACPGATSFLTACNSPKFLRAFHGWAALSFALISIPGLIWWRESIVLITFVSLWTAVTGELSAWQSARVEVRQEQEQRRPRRRNIGRAGADAKRETAVTRRQAPKRTSVEGRSRPRAE